MWESIASTPLSNEIYVVHGYIQPYTHAGTNTRRRHTEYERMCAVKRRALPPQSYGNGHVKELLPYCVRNTDYVPRSWWSSLMSPYGRKQDGMGVLSSCMATWHSFGLLSRKMTRYTKRTTSLAVIWRNAYIYVIAWTHFFLWLLRTEKPALQYALYTVIMERYQRLCVQFNAVRCYWVDRSLSVSVRSTKCFKLRLLI
jgi:hypothetical protein